jgi:hypothetical protein
MTQAMQPNNGQRARTDPNQYQSQGDQALMAATKAELTDWLASFDDEDQIAIDNGGLALVLVGQENEAYFEIGGIPNDEEGG